MEKRIDIIRYNVKKCLPLVLIYFFGLFCAILFLHSKLHAYGDSYLTPEMRRGVTIFKSCLWCGELNDQENITCFSCGTKSFRDVFLKDAGDKHDIKRKKHAKGLRAKRLNCKVRKITESSDEKKTKLGPMHRA
jgi:hypothetical protein